ncbi:dynein regulatory complex protein 1-like [Centruroides sculpturatus]|uniref:dynein regulatory complex protein 1-like n=1 Tax=Centruroides sculpturatus TaxID=218467 RepID=UPI000C6E84C4|nr:dynein regulatory complex protein 1-like [Centruroides sculpturatus]
MSLEVKNSIKGSEFQELLDDLGIREDISDIASKKTNHSFLQVYNDGYERVSNVFVAFIQRVKQKRLEEQKFRDSKREELKKFSESVAFQFQKCVQRWNERKVKLPVEIHHLMQEEKKNCEFILKEMDCKVENLKILLEEREKKYEDELEELRNDLSYLIKKSECLINHLYDLSREEIQTMIDFSVRETRKKHTKCFNAWKKKSQEILDGRGFYLQTLEQRRKEYEHEIRKEEKLSSEEYVILRRRLLDDVRSEEWDKLIPEQKRELIHLSKKFEQLQYLLRMLQDQQTLKRIQIHKDRKDLTEKLKKSEERWEYLRFLENRKYVDVFILRTNEIKELCSRVLGADKAIRENILGIKWEKINFQEGKASKSPSFETESWNFQWKFHLFNIICEQMSFLIKDKFLFPKGTNLLKLDTLLNILGIKTSKDLEYFLQYFRNCSEYDETILVNVKEFLENKIKTKNWYQHEHEEVKVEDWKECINLIPKERLLLWETLYEMQKNYHELLKRRSRLLKHKKELTLKNYKLINVKSRLNVKKT